MLNDVSFNDFIRNTLGNEDNKVGGPALETDFDRPSLGGGIHRGSSDIVMFNSSSQKKPNHNTSQQKKQNSKPSQDIHKYIISSKK
jgi:hypothetical protein